MKKNFNQGINSLLLNTREVKEDTPETNVLEDLKDSEGEKNKEVKGSVKAGLKEGETRATLILNEVVINKFKAISYWDRVPLKVIMDDALSVFLNRYEEKNGKIKPLKA
jgi:hypothetical protein